MNGLRLCLQRRDEVTVLVWDANMKKAGRWRISIILEQKALSGLDNVPIKGIAL